MYASVFEPDLGVNHGNIQQYTPRVIIIRDQPPDVGYNHTSEADRPSA